MESLSTEVVITPAVTDELLGLAAGVALPPPEHAETKHKAARMAIIKADFDFIYLLRALR
jgi:hypothetical protein